MMIRQELRVLQLIEHSAHKLVDALIDGMQPDQKTSETCALIVKFGETMQEYENEARVPLQYIRPTFFAGIRFVLAAGLYWLATVLTWRDMTAKQQDALCLFADTLDEDERWHKLSGTMR